MACFDEEKFVNTNSSSLQNFISNFGYTWISYDIVQLLDTELAT